MAKRYGRDRPQKGIIKGDTDKTPKRQRPLEVFPISQKKEKTKSFGKKKQIKDKLSISEDEPLEEIHITELEERFDKAFGLSLGLIAIMSLLFFIPIIGPFIGISFVPYLACNLGCRHVQRNNGLQVGFLVGLLWSIIEIYLLFQILNIVRISVTDPGIYTNLDLAIIIIVFIANIFFCMIGGYSGGRKFIRTKMRKRKKMTAQT